MLDPTNIDAAKVLDTYRIADLPRITPQQEQFGFMPNVEALRVGDLLLAKRLQPDTGTRLIRRAQDAHGTLGSQWSHAAIYAGEWRIFEANPKTNISTGRLDSWIPQTTILVRRPALFSQMPETEGKLAGARLALEAAMLQTNGRYGMAAAFGVGVRLVTNYVPGLSSAPPELQNASIICSGLYAKCYAITTRSSLMSAEQIRTDEPVTPQLLSRVTSLETIEIGWRRLVP